MDSQVRPDTTSLGEQEFTVPCTASRDSCDLPARWAVWVAHTMKGCENTATCCDYHKKLMDELWRDEMKYVPKHCRHCGADISPVLEDNIRWMPL